MTVTFETKDGRKIVFTDVKIYEAYERPASGEHNTEVKVIFFTNDHDFDVVDAIRDLNQLEDNDGDREQVPDALQT